MSAIKGNERKIKNLNGSFTGLVKPSGFIKTFDKLLISIGILISGQRSRPTIVKIKKIRRVINLFFKY